MPIPAARPTGRGGPDGGSPITRIARDILSQTTTTAVTTLAIQLATFAVLAAAPLVLDNAAFAALALIVAATMLANAAFDLGLNLASTKFFGDSGDPRWFRAAFRVRLLCLPLAALAALALLVAGGPAPIAMGVICGGALNLWNGIRATDQARQDYASFARASMVFAALRIVFGAGALVILRDPLAVAAGLYILPVLAVRVSGAWADLAGAWRGGWQEDGGGSARMLRYAAFVYLNALVFTGLPYMPQFLIAHRFDAVAVGTYGLILTFTAPVSLVIYALRAVLLPKMLGGGTGLEEALWSRRGLGAIALAAGLFCLCGAVVAVGLDHVYGARFPGIGQGFMLFFAGFAITAAIGFYSLSVHTLGLPQLAMWIALAKAALLAALLAVFGQSLLGVIVLTGAVMIAGEAALALALARARRRRMP